MQLTQVKGLVGTLGEARLVLGMLRRDVKNRLVIEDASGSVPVVGLCDADTSTLQGFLPQGACMLVLGEMQASGVFRARSVKEPPVENRQDAVASLRGLNISGARSLRYNPWPQPPSYRCLVCTFKLASTKRMAHVICLLVHFVPPQ